MDRHVSTYFIADLHLSAEEPHLVALFKHFLTNILQEGDTLFILGDLFAFWIGDDDLTLFNRSIIACLAALHERQIPVALLVGNRDFLIKQRFAARAKLTLLTEKYLLAMGQEKILLLHGDTLCTLDHHYQTFRRWTQKKWLQTLFLWLPLSWRRRIALKLRRQSSELKPAFNSAMMDVVTGSVLQDCQDYQVLIMVHGHTHLPGIHGYYKEQTWLMRYTLGDWGQQGHYLMIDQTGHKSLHYFDENTGGR